MTEENSNSVETQSWSSRSGLTLRALTLLIIYTSKKTEDMVSQTLNLFPEMGFALIQKAPTQSVQAHTVNSLEWHRGAFNKKVIWSIMGDFAWFFPAFWTWPDHSPLQKQKSQCLCIHFSKNKLWDTSHFKILKEKNGAWIACKEYKICKWGKTNFSCFLK